MLVVIREEGVEGLVAAEMQDADPAQEGEHGCVLCEVAEVECQADAFDVFFPRAWLRVEVLNDAVAEAGHGERVPDTDPERREQLDQSELVEGSKTSEEVAVEDEVDQKVVVLEGENESTTSDFVFQDPMRDQG